jgi:hypothetical protein
VILYVDSRFRLTERHRRPRSPGKEPTTLGTGLVHTHVRLAVSVPPTTRVTLIVARHQVSFREPYRIKAPQVLFLHADAKQQGVRIFVGCHIRAYWLSLCIARDNHDCVMHNW